MNNWEPFLHWTFRQEHVLIRPLVLHSFPSFILAGLFLTPLCISERMLTFSLERHWTPQLLSRSRWRKAFWRTFLYSVVTFLRLSYMLATMSFQLGVILVIVFSLSAGQFLIEYWGSMGESPVPRGDGEYRVPLIEPHSRSYPLNSVANNSQRSREQSESKPRNIFIHPVNSNIARADAAAQQLGVSGVTDRARVSRVTDTNGGIGQEILKPSKFFGHAHRDTTKGQDDEESSLMDGLDSERES